MALELKNGYAVNVCGNELFRSIRMGFAGTTPFFSRTNSSNTDLKGPVK
ncbi:MAG: hypothetical protein R6X10_17355 [Desulfobacterales bacterium]